MLIIDSDFIAKPILSTTLDRNNTCSLSSRDAAQSDTVILLFDTLKLRGVNAYV
jgi:hypothetical protein